MLTCVRLLVGFTSASAVMLYILSTSARRVHPWLPNKFLKAEPYTSTFGFLPVAIQVTELLYTKQTQLERLAAEKAAQQLTHERQLSQAKDDAERVKRCVRSVHALHVFYTSNALRAVCMLATLPRPSGSAPDAQSDLS